MSNSPVQRQEISIKPPYMTPLTSISPSDYFYSHYQNEETMHLTTGTYMKKQKSRINLKNRFYQSRSSHQIYIQHEILYESSQTSLSSDLEQSSFEISKFPLLVTTPDKSKDKKLTSTVIENETTLNSLLTKETTDKWPSHIYTMPSTHPMSEESAFSEESSNAFSNYLYNSPPLTRKKPKLCESLASSSDVNTTPSSCYTNSSVASSTSANSTGFSNRYVDSFGFHTKDFQTANSKIFNDEKVDDSSNMSYFTAVRKSEKVSVRNESHVFNDTAHINDQASQIYICCISYEAKSPTELSIEFTDRLKLIQQLEDMDYCLVQNLLTKKYGYVPRHCISELSTFLKDVKYLRKKYWKLNDLIITKNYD